MSKESPKRDDRNGNAKIIMNPIELERRITDRRWFTFNDDEWMQILLSIQKKTVDAENKKKLNKSMKLIHGIENYKKKRNVKEIQQKQPWWYVYIKTYYYDWK